MTNKEFIEYRKELTKDLKVDKDGNISGDNIVRYTLFYGGVAKEQVMGVTVAEAVYRAILLLSIQGLNKLIKEKCESNDEIMKFADFSEFSASIEVDDNNRKNINIKYNDDIYTLKIADTETHSTDAIDRVIDIAIDDNIVKVFYMYDDATTICNIVNSPYSMYKFNLKPEIELNVKYNVAMEYLRLETTNVSLFFGYASLADEDKFDIDKGKDISYKRAILEKIKIDKINHNFMIKSTNEKIRDLVKIVRGFSHTVKTLNKREKQIERYIHDITK